MVILLIPVSLLRFPADLGIMITPNKRVRYGYVWITFAERTGIGVPVRPVFLFSFFHYAFNNFFFCRTSSGNLR